jgi:hypothetical protein
MIDEDLCHDLLEPHLVNFLTIPLPLDLPLYRCQHTAGQTTFMLSRTLPWMSKTSNCDPSHAWVALPSCGGGQGPSRGASLPAPTPSSSCRTGCPSNPQAWVSACRLYGCVTCCRAFDAEFRRRPSSTPRTMRPHRRPTRRCVCHIRGCPYTYTLEWVK